MEVFRLEISIADRCAALGDMLWRSPISGTIKAEVIKLRMETLYVNNDRQMYLYFCQRAIIQIRWKGQ